MGEYPDVLTVMHVIAPAATGGLENVVRMLATGHRQRGLGVRVAAIILDPSGAEPAVVHSLRDAGVEVHARAIAARAYLGERAWISELCRTLRPDVVHTHGYRTDLVDSGAARGRGIATVTTVHGTTSVGWKDRLYEGLQRRAFRRFDAVVAVSRPLEMELLRSGVPRDRLHLVPNAFAPAGAQMSRAQARERLGLPADAFVAGWVGRLSAEKGADVFLRAVALVPDCLASVVGDGADRPMLTQLAGELGITDRVRWHGMVPDAGHYLSAFDALVLSSRREGTPIVLLEAMHARVPIVTTRVGGIPDVVTDEDALLVDPEDPPALAAAISRSGSDTAGAQARAHAAAERLATHFQADAWLDRYADIYRRVARLSVPRS